MQILTSAECTVPDKLRSYTKRTRYAEQDSVVLHLRETIVCKEHAGVCIHVRPGVLRLASLHMTLKGRKNLTK
jgi:hypothetical protein